MIIKILKKFKTFDLLTYFSVGVGFLVIISLSSLMILEIQYKGIDQKVINKENPPQGNKNPNKKETEQKTLEIITITPTVSLSSTRTPNPPIGVISWPAEGETINNSQDQICFVDAGTGGDQTGIQRRRNINNGGWESYIPVFPSSSTCFNPKEGTNTFSIQYKNQSQEESGIYSRNFAFHKIIPTPEPLKDTIPPVINQLDGPAEGSVITTDEFCLTAHVTDNVSKSPNLWIRYKFEGGEWQYWTTNFSACFSTRGNDQTTIFSIQAKDEAGNESSPLTRTFSTKTH